MGMQHMPLQGGLQAGLLLQDCLHLQRFHAVLAISWPHSFWQLQCQPAVRESCQGRCCTPAFIMGIWHMTCYTSSQQTLCACIPALASCLESATSLPQTDKYGPRPNACLSAGVSTGSCCVASGPPCSLLAGGPSL